MTTRLDAKFTTPSVGAAGDALCFYIAPGLDIDTYAFIRLLR